MNQWCVGVMPEGLRPSEHSKITPKLAACRNRTYLRIRISSEQLGELALEAFVIELPLYDPVMWPCSCCGLDRVFTFMSQTDQTVCDLCRRHGQDTDRRLALHRDWWREHDEALHAEYTAQAAIWRAAADALEAKIVERDRKLADMRLVAIRGYEQTPLGGIRAWLQEGIVLDAESKLRGAYWARDKVMGTIWRFDRLHNDTEKPGTCSCGKRTDQCKEFKTLAPVVDALYKWETKQLEVLRRGYEHNLPKEHPEVQRQRNRGYVA